MNRSLTFGVSRPDSNAKPDISSFQRWMVALCAIRFDLQQGQIVEECYPVNALSPEEELDVAFSSFPDSMSQASTRASVHDCVFFFRIRRRGISPVYNTASHQSGNSDNSGSKGASARGGPVTERITVQGLGNSCGGPGSGAPRYLYGFVFNRQRQDERLRRGGEQKSMVILSERPYSSVFKPLVQIAGPLYFDIGSRALEQVATYVSQWGPPLHGQLMELPVGSISLRAHLPPAHTLPPGCGTPMDDFTSAMAPALPLNRSVPQGIFNETDLFGAFRGVLMQLWVLWELLLIGEPLLVVAPTPSQVCEAVASLVSLVAPLPCSVDFRPYFTIHDPDFASLNSIKEGEQGPPMVLGVTNLFFLKALRNLPHVISVGTSLTTPNRLKYTARSNSHNGNRRLSLQLQLSPLTRFSPSNLLKVARVRKDGPLSLMTEHHEALWTNYGAATKPDTSVLNRLVDAGMSPRTEESMSMVNNEVLRRHFLELTTNFLAPFGPYLRATTPQEGASPFRDPPPLAPFNAHDFLDGLSARGPGKFLAKRLRSNWLELYRRFLEGPNFMPWFQRRRAVAEQEQHRIWQQARSKAQVASFLASMSEVEVVDSFSAVERHLLAEMQMLQRAGLTSTETPTVKKLRSDMCTIFSMLPSDVQQILLLNPQRSNLLQVSGSGVQNTQVGSPGQQCQESNLGPPLAHHQPSPLGFQTGDVPKSSLHSEELLQDPLDLNRT
ncbi:unnamed protein product [Sphagnum troendelagicum]|uniref:UDENN domain-containing protein n=1 Tax=Sphagnum troendelagicum TaxID=128251 RepID=A0ABP0UNT0_9BRYO